MLSTLLTLNVFIQHANAGTMYRCGNTYQDTKCVSTATTKVVGKTAAVTSLSPASQLPASQLPASGTALKIDADCVLQGETAKKIMWMREIGKTADDQIAAPPAGASPGLIRDVYSHRGSSLEVKNATYLDGYRLSIMFNNGKNKVVDFSHFLENNRKEVFSKYKDVSNFKKFKIEDGNLVWGRNWDLIFPIDNLYKGRIE